MNSIDFRSDTVTLPTPAMRQAMMEAPLGDDVYGEDPTVNALQEQAAALLGKEAGLLVASGTMGNVVSVLAHANRGDEAILGRDSHLLNAETGSLATLGGIVPQALSTDDAGQMDLAELSAAIRPDNEHYAHTQLICVENSYGSKCGAPLSLSYLAGIYDIAKKYNLKVHMDGARLFNAAVATNTAAADIVKYADSVSFCLSKGLSCPIGSVICGSEAFIKKARRIRKSLGGGMRQAGIFAAAGLVALSENIERLADDHAHAQLLANGLNQIPGIVIEPERIKTNIVMFELAAESPFTAAQLVAWAEEHAGIKFGAIGEKRFRAITHYWVGEREVNALLSAIREALDRLPAKNG